MSQNTSKVTAVLDNEVCLKLGKLIEVLTRSGLKTLDEKTFKEVKKICKLSPGYVEKAYRLLMLQLKKRHSEIRYSAFQMCIELFERSSVFRELLLKELQLVFILTAETEPKKPLPPPKTIAQNLKVLALSTLQNWTNKFGSTYKELQIAYHYLKHCKRVDFAALEMRNSAEQTRQRELERHQKVISEEKMKKLKDEMNENETEIENAITVLSNCISLLLPSPDNFFIADNSKSTELSSAFNNNNENAGKSLEKTNASDDEESEEEDEDDIGSSVDLREHGINPKFGLSLNIQLDKKIKIKKTDENITIIENANDTVRLITNRLLPMVKKWIQICTKYSMNGAQDIKQIIDLKDRLQNAVDKYKELNIDDICGGIDSSDDDDFEEVQKEGYEDTVKDLEYNMPAVKNLMMNSKKTEAEWKISLGDDEKDPTGALPTLKQLKSSENSTQESSVSSKSASEKPSTSKDADQKPNQDKPSSSKDLDRKQKLLASAPKLPFDVDLYHWEDEKLSVPTILSVKSDNHSFWGVSSVDEMDEIPNPEGVAALRTRVIEFAGNFEPVKWSCRAPLPNGKLCPRKDRYKCPFHGEIVPRDERGKCQNEEDEKRLKKQKEEKEQDQPEWQDPELLADLERATGMNLKMPEKKGKKRKKKNDKRRIDKRMKTSASTLREIEERKFPGLTDIDARQNNSYKRLSKKIFNKTSLKRVAATLNKIEHKKHRDKFYDQFNYMLGTS